MRSDYLKRLMMEDRYAISSKIGEANQFITEYLYKIDDKEDQEYLLKIGNKLDHIQFNLIG
jgi:hypothetical protein